jgi:hypothetical protein
MNRHILRTTLLALVACVASSAFAQIQVVVDGTPVRFTGAQPQMIDGRVLVPLRGVMERLGAHVEWVPASQTVHAHRGATEVALRIGQRTAQIGSRSVSLDVPAQIIRGSTMVPLRFVGEALGADVTWEPMTQTVRIQTDAATTVTQPPVVDTRENRVVQINSFTHTAAGWVRGGHTIEFVLEGTPGGQARIHIPGVETEIAMTERSPGRYIAEWTPRTRDGRAITLGQASVIASLRVGQNERMIQAGQALSVDTQAPEIRNVLPAPNAQMAAGRPNITAVLEDPAGSGVDPATVRLTLNGRDITDQATVTQNFVAYRPAEDLAPGQYRVELTARDRAGNEAREAWTFTVQALGDLVTEFTHTGRDNVRPGEEIVFTLRGQTGMQVALNVGDHIRNLQMREESPGVYRAAYVVRTADRFQNDPVIATMTTAAGQRVTAEAIERVAHDARVAVQAPKITSPSQNQAPSNPLVIRGTAPANSRVHVRVEYSSTLLGLLRTSGAVADVVVTADAKGNWQTEEIRLDSLLRGSGTEYTISARTLGSQGAQSEATVLVLRQR